MAESHRATGRDLTSGSLHRAIWYLAPPMMLETGILNVAQILDTYWVGRLGSAALAAVTISITIRWVLNSLANGLGIGGMAVVARRIGAKEQAAAEHATWQTILLGLTVSLLLTVAGLVAARPLLLLLGADAKVLPLGLAYLRISFAGIFTLILVFAINSMLRGAGEARLAMQVLFLSTAVTVVLEPILIFGFGPLPASGVAGSAWANVLGFGVGLALQTVVLLRGRARLHLNLRDLRPDFPLMGRIIQIALPSTVQMTLRSSSRLIVVGLVGAYGTFATAGYGVANRMLLIALIPCFGLGNSAGTLVGQNLGARQPDRAERSAWWVSGYAAAYMAVAAILLTVFAPSLIALFDATPQVVAFGSECVRIVAWSMIASAVGVVLARGFDGAGNTVPAMAINLLTLWGLELPLAFGLSRWLGLGATGVWWGRALANLANGLLFAFWFIQGGWKRKDV
ncbi:MAG TPA: MATE family efflux transporter [Anaerolineae bacterium]|nr:MATE family efflux transporter [Anaerolineae bacterium]